MMVLRFLACFVFFISSFNAAALPATEKISNKSQITKKTTVKKKSSHHKKTHSPKQKTASSTPKYLKKQNSFVQFPHAHELTQQPNSVVQNATQVTKPALKDPLADEISANETDQNQPEDSPADLEKKIMIRVLLKEASTDQKITFAIQSNKGFALESPIKSGNRAHWKHQILNVLAYQHNLFLLTKHGTYKRIKTNEIAIASIDGDLKIDNNRYSGVMYLRIDPETKNVQMVNKINLDDYIYAVLRYESLSYWPLEMQKVQAVASRSYAVRQIQNTKNNAKTSSFYDIKNNNFHQVYNGNHDSFHLREAVNQTHNLVLTYKDTVALTMFDICCGGIIPAYMKKQDADKPYLFRKNRCQFCLNKANYTWDYAINKNSLLDIMKDNEKLASRAHKIGKITGISLKSKDRAGIVQRVLVHGSKNNISFACNEFKNLLGSKARSSAYTVKKLQDDILVHGYGFGHNIGLCQIGARELVSRGKDYKEILDFYFPKTKIRRLKVI